VNPYRKGGYYEAKTLDLFTLEGYVCWQARGSKGPADIVAIKPGQVVLIQVKSGLREISGREWNALYELAQRLGAVPVVAHWPAARQPVELTRIMGQHRDNSPLWSFEPFVLDQIEAAVARHPARGRD
jgi:Holliday junction resolvase